MVVVGALFSWFLFMKNGILVSWKLKWHLSKHWFLFTMLHAHYSWCEHYSDRVFHSRVEISGQFVHLGGPLSLERSESIVDLLKHAIQVSCLCSLCLSWNPRAAEKFGAPSIIVFSDLKHPWARHPNASTRCRSGGVGYSPAVPTVSVVASSTAAVSVSTRDQADSSKRAAGYSASATEAARVCGGPEIPHTEH